jgi:hypothetical protein
MKIASTAMSVGLGFIVAWVTLLFVPVPQTSGYAQMPNVLSMGPIDDTDNKALLAVGLLSKKSVMDSPEKKKELQPAAPPPDVAENKPLPPVPKAPAPAPPPADGPRATAPASTDMSTVPASGPKPAPQMPSPMPPSPTGPQPSSTGSSTYAPAAM